MDTGNDQEIGKGSRGSSQIGLGKYEERNLAGKQNAELHLKGATDKKRSRIEGEAYLQTMDPGRSESRPRKMDGSSQIGLGSHEERGLAGKQNAELHLRGVTDESQQQPDNIHGNKVNMDEGEPAGISNGIKLNR